MQELNEANKILLLQQSTNGYDGLIRSFRHSYGTATDPALTEITISVKNHNGEWHNLLFKLQGVSTFLIREGPGCYQVLSNGFTFDWFENKLYFSFDLNPAEVNSRKDFLESGFFFIAEIGWWEIIPYSE